MTVLLSGLWWVISYIAEPENFLFDAKMGGTLLIIAAAVDRRSYLLPDKLNVGLAFIGLLGALGRGEAKEAVLGAATAVLIFGLLYCITDGLGLGDVKLAAAGGLFAGSWQAGLAAVIIAFLGGGARALFLLLSGRCKRNGRLAFGPYLAAGILTAKTAGQWLWSFYLGLLGWG